MATFKRGLNPRFVAALNAAYNEPDSWWKKLVDDPGLFIGIRGNQISAYYNGANIIRISHERGTLVGATHFKYLVPISRSETYIKFQNGKYDEDQLNAIQFSTNLKRDLAAIKNASTPYRSEEAKGVHDIIRSNNNIIDTEIAFGDEGNRIDFAAFKDGPKRPELVFYEAKLLNNKEVSGQDPAVIQQVERYRQLLSKTTRRKEIQKSYEQVAENIGALHGFPTGLKTICQRANTQGFDISNDVRLVIYGYGRAQQKEANPLFTRLRQQIGQDFVLTKGTAKGMTKGIST